MVESDPLARSKWNVQAVVIIFTLVAFFALSGYGLVVGKLSWTDWLNAVVPLLAMALGWLLRGQQQQ